MTETSSCAPLAPTTQDRGHSMTPRDWLSTGIKLLGVYFGVLGLTGLVTFVTTFAVALQPVACLVCAFVMVKRTEWCLLLVHGDTIRPKPS